MNKILSIIQRQRESGSGAPFKYFVNERAGDTSQIMSKEIENTVDSALETAQGQGIKATPAPAKCPDDQVMDKNGKCVPKETGKLDKTTGVLDVDTDNLSGNTTKTDT